MLAAASLWVAIPGVPAALAGILFVGLGTAAAMDRALLRGRSAIRAIEIRGPEEIRLELRDGTIQAARCDRRRHVSRFGVGMRLAGWRRRGLFVATGMLDPEAARRLRLWALWGKVPGGREKSLPA